MFLKWDGRLGQLLEMHGTYTTAQNTQQRRIGKYAVAALQQRRVSFPWSRLLCCTSHVCVIATSIVMNTCIVRSSARAHCLANNARAQERQGEGGARFLYCIVSYRVTVARTLGNLPLNNNLRLIRMSLFSVCQLLCPYYACDVCLRTDAQRLLLIGRLVECNHTRHPASTATSCRRETSNFPAIASYAAALATTSFRRQS